jgi:fumarylacetoacetase
MTASWWQTDRTPDPARASWVESARHHPDFPIQNLPYGIFSPPGGYPRAGVAIGDCILDLQACADAELLAPLASSACRMPSINQVLALPVEPRLELRHRISELLSDPAHQAVLKPFLHDMAECALCLPARIGDYTDFYVGIHHATNVGRLFRPDTPLLPNYKYVPIGYHGRASSVRASGQLVRRPSGQKKGAEQNAPIFGPTRKLDYEVELGVWIGMGNPLGTPISIDVAADHIAGFCLLNDWSARDFQAWEYQPLGPFLAKSFHTTVSPWVVTAEAMAPFRCAQPVRPTGDPAPLAYLCDADDQRHGALVLSLEAYLLTRKMRADKLPPFRISRAAATNMYWTVNQIVAHHASNGCNLRPGDLLGTGTISAPTVDGFGSLLELTEGGNKPVALPKSESRYFLEDGDEIILKAVAAAPGFVSIGFGECRAIVEGS